MNKKIVNAEKTKLGILNFKSKLEKSVYLTLLQYGFEPQYEPKTYCLIDGFNPVTPYYDKETDTQRNKRISSGDTDPARLLVLKNQKVVGIRYTPDFSFKYNNLNVFIEVKGYENDIFYIKKKLFIRYLDQLHEEDNSYNAIYFEIYTKKQLLQAIDIIKDYGKNID